MRPAKLADPVHLRGEPAFLDRTGKRALRTVPVCRTSGSPVAPALKISQDQAGAARVHLSSTLQPSSYGETIRSHARPKTSASYLSSPPLNGQQRSVANPRGTGEMRVKGGCIVPSRRVPPKRVRRPGRGADTSPYAESPGRRCAGHFRLLLGSFTSY